MAIKRKGTAHANAEPSRRAKAKSRMAPEPGDAFVLTVEEAARKLRIGRTSMYDLIRRDSVRSILIGRARRIPVAALEEFIRLQMPA